MEVRNLYVNCQNAGECYEFTVVSSKILSQNRLPPILHHKELFAYESILAHAITRRCMHVHAVLSSFKARQLSTTEERIARWPHRLDV